MSEKEKQAAQSIAEAMKQLSEAKREYLIGFAEGVAAMSEARREEEKSA